MIFGPDVLLPLLWRTVKDPSGAAQEILSWQLSRAILWQVLVLVCALSALTIGMFGGDALALPMGENVLRLSPIGYAFVLGAGLVMMVFAIHYTGASLGGRGNFADALAAVVWIECVALCFRVLQVPLQLINGDLLAIVSIAGVIVLIWAFINFIDQVHEFHSLGKSVATLVLAVVGIILGTSIIIALIGVGTGLTPPMEA